MQRPGDSRRLLLVGARAETAAKARAAGFRVWRLPDSASGHPADPAAEVRSLTHRHRIGRVLHTGDGRARLAALEDADATGLALTSARSVRRLTDPVALRRLLREDGRFAARSRETASADQAAEAVRETGLPAVVRHCGSPDGRTALLTEPGDLTAWRAATRDEDGPFLVEEFVEGPLFVVYALTVDGLHHMLAVTNRRSAGALVTEVCPAPVGNRQVAELRSAAGALLDLADFQCGLAHVTVVLGADGPRIVGSGTGTGRHGGELLRAAAGFDPETWLFRALAGERVTRPEPWRTATIAHRLPPRRSPAAVP
ncbi:acetyl-CoA carboxylase biotin carboxylase subunit family protein [Streptomyces rochei]|uniref:ATP-grasp domain-containing protein n=1 Tax=Streptomyces rochei TaxID=1928 RepID=UPI0036AC90F1